MPEAPHKFRRRNEQDEEDGDRDIGEVDNLGVEQERGIADERCELHDDGKIERVQKVEGIEDRNDIGQEEIPIVHLRQEERDRQHAHKADM